MTKPVRPQNCARHDPRAGVEAPHWVALHKAETRLSKAGMNAHWPPAPAILNLTLQSRISFVHIPKAAGASFIKEAKRVFCNFWPQVEYSGSSDATPTLVESARGAGMPSWYARPACMCGRCITNAP